MMWSLREKGRVKKAVKWRALREYPEYRRWDDMRDLKETTRLIETESDDNDDDRHLCRKWEPGRSLNAFALPTPSGETRRSGDGIARRTIRLR